MQQGRLAAVACRVPVFVECLSIFVAAMEAASRGTASTEVSIWLKIAPSFKAWLEVLEKCALGSKVKSKVI